MFTFHIRTRGKRSNVYKELKKKHPILFFISIRIFGKIFLHFGGLVGDDNFNCCTLRNTCTGLFLVNDVLKHF